MVSSSAFAVAGAATAAAVTGGVTAAALACALRDGGLGCFAAATRAAFRDSGVDAGLAAGGGVVGWSSAAGSSGCDSTAPIAVNTSVNVNLCLVYM